MDLGNSTDVVGGLENFLHLDPILDSIQRILNDYQPAAYLIAFVLLVVGTMREFLIPETRRFLHTLMRAVLLVASIGFLPSCLDWFDQAFKALAELPAAESITFGDSSYSIKTDGHGARVTEIEKVLESKIPGTPGGPASPRGKDSLTKPSPQKSENPWDLGNKVAKMWNYIVSRGVNLVWQILFAIYLLCLLLCKIIIVLMLFLQKVTVMGFKLYAPIGVAEYAHHTLRGKATSFFLTFVGIMTWPVGWSIVNAVTLGVLKSIPSPQDQNFSTLIVAIVLVVPILLWVVIGHVVAPIYMQKIVVRGGGVIQGFTGTMFSVIGTGSMATQAAVLSDGADWLKNSRRRREDGKGAKRGSSRGKGFEPLMTAADDFLGPGASETFQGGLAQAGKSFREQDSRRGRLADFGADALDAGARLAYRMGNAARFIGHAVAEGSGDGAGLDYRALAAFAPQSANARSSINRGNRSSLQARKYLLEEYE